MQIEELGTERQLISPIGWYEGQNVFNGKLECTVMEVIDDDNVELWVKNGSWRGIYNHTDNKLLVVQMNECHSCTDPFYETFDDDDFTSYGHRMPPPTASEKKAIEDAKEQQRLEDLNWFHPCDMCGAHKKSCLCNVPF